MSAAATETETIFLVKGQGVAIHIAKVWGPENLGTLCDTWGGSGARIYRLRKTTGPATCKSCIKSAK